MENLKIFFPEIFSTRKNEKFWNWKFNYSGVRASKNLKPGSWDSLQWALHIMYRRQGVVTIEKMAKKLKKENCQVAKMVYDVIG